ncbi:MAG TPA: YicC/YloC family endoribonuclease [Planctomycetaceae bacterium]|nr:YicC/YloC family endoribonuclease [Planctomycetaceae bacterium]
MLLSMTGFGDARCQDERLSASVEVRAVNNRYLKISTKCSEAYAALEGDIERLVRESISRGTVNVTVRVDRLWCPEEFALNQVALKSYWSQLHEAARELHAPPPAELGYLLSAPGVVADESRRSVDLHADGEMIRRLLAEALMKLGAFRAEEGRSMERELSENARTIAARLTDVAALAPQVVAEYRVKLLERVRQLVSASGVAVVEPDLIREVSIFSDRSDINEEITRLRSHLEQFQTFLREPASAGRKLDFLSQEMNREVNTIGSKANNVTIAHSVVEMKAAIEKMREILQNVE